MKNVLTGTWGFLNGAKKIFPRAILALFAGAFFGWFSFASYRAWRLQTSDHFSCAVEFRDVRNSFSYIQFDLREQHPNEPYFNGGLFINMGDKPTGPFKVTTVLSGSRGYGDQVYDLDLRYDDHNKDLMMGKASDVALYRVSGSPRDFPFDSTNFDFTATYTPALNASALFFRNLNSSFYIPCEEVRVERMSERAYRIKFPAIRNPLVKMTAMILLFAGAIFLFGIAFYVREDALPTAVASYFFSLWSIRSILSSEIKAFPTLIDLVILSFCVLLLIGVALRLAFTTGWRTASRMAGKPSK